MARRIGEARATYFQLAAVWNHASISKMRKFRIFEACVVSKLLYGLESLWPLQQDLKRLDGFYAWCLRRISKVAPPFVSRISNASILERFQTLPLSTKLRKKQLDLYGRFVLQPEDALTRRVALQPASFEPVNWQPRRRVGRPCFRWPAKVYEMILKMMGNRMHIQRMHEASAPNLWRSLSTRCVADL